MWKTITPKSSGRKIDYEVRLSRFKDDSISIVISSSLMKRMRWKRGDKVHVMIDEENGMLGVMRTTEHQARTLCSPGGTDKREVKAGGCPASVRFTADSKIVDRCVNGKPRFFDHANVVCDMDQDVVAVELLPRK